jgi:hypothetical protein
MDDPKRSLPDNPHPEAEERFNRLLAAMAKPVGQIRLEEDQTLDEERDEDCGDIQTPTDTSEDVS